MNTRPRLAEVLKLLKTSKGIRVRAGTAQHRFIGIWFVLVADRIFARSWSVKLNGWYHTFLKESRGTIQVGKIEIAVRPVRIRSKRLKDEVDRAYLNKYSSRGEVKYATTSPQKNPELRPSNSYPSKVTSHHSQIGKKRHCSPQLKKKVRTWT